MQTICELFPNDPSLMNKVDLIFNITSFIHRGYGLNTFDSYASDRTAYRSPSQPQITNEYHASNTISVSIVIEQENKSES